MLLWPYWVWLSDFRFAEPSSQGANVSEGADVSEGGGLRKGIDVVWAHSKRAMGLLWEPPLLHRSLWSGSSCSHWAYCAHPWRFRTPAFRASTKNCRKTPKNEPLFAPFHTIH